MRLILKYLNKIKQLFVIIPVVIVTMLVSGLFFANKKSQPEFDSKAERIMFETKNQSPKYVITLPAKQLKKIVTEEVEEVVAPPVIGEKSKTNNEKLNELIIPFLSQLPAVEGQTPLKQIMPDNGLLEDEGEAKGLPVRYGTLKAWEVYGRKVQVMPMFNKVAVVIKNMGMNKVNSELIISKVPENVSLSFSPYSYSLAEQIKKARENGHETYLDMLLPSRSYLLEDSGDYALDFTKSSSENVRMLERLLGGNFAVGGFTLRDGVDDEKYSEQFLAVMTMLEKRGLLLFDATHGETINQNNVAGLDRVKADVVIDENFSKDSIVERLKIAENLARRNGNVVVAVDPKPVAVLAVVEWLSTFSKQLSYAEMKAQNVTSFDRPFVLVPLSNMAVEY